MDSSDDGARGGIEFGGELGASAVVVLAGWS